MDPTERHARVLDTQALHSIAIRHANRAQDGAVDMVAAELRRREAWAAPAGRAFWISVAALVVSLLAVTVSLLHART